MKDTRWHRSGSWPWRRAGRSGRARGRSVGFAVLLGVFALHAQAQTPVVGADIDRIMREVCAECHGPDGNSRYPWVPNLAAQNADYLYAQLQRFRQGLRSDHVMNDIARSLDDDSLQRLARRYSTLPSAPIRMPSGGDKTLGEQLYRQRCIECHGADGRGRAGFAWVAGQQPEYVRRSLRRYRDGFKSRNHPLMREATRGLDEEQIAALAAYLAAMR